MTGLIGRTLDRYEIVSLLGVGGMGSVYRARDTAMSRNVAVKVLPDLASDDPHRLERFNREIRAQHEADQGSIVNRHGGSRSEMPVRRHRYPGPWIRSRASAWTG